METFGKPFTGSRAMVVRVDIQRFPRTQVYQGGATHINVSVPAGGAFYRAHACNSAGCSDWTGTEHALYFTGCL
jgi:hypothetical protein